MKEVLITKYQCSKEGCLHDTRDEAIRHEIANLEISEKHELRQVQPPWEDFYEKYERKCCFCKKLLREYACWWDGHRNNLGPKIKEEPLTVIARRWYVCKDAHSDEEIELRKKIHKIETKYKALKGSVG